jgi:hypothetical protein
MRPTIDHLLDCQIQIWRPTKAKDSIGVEERTYTPASIVDAFLNRPAQGEADLGAGLAPVGSVRWYGKPTIDVLVRDVCEVISGPETGKTFEVNSPPVRPKNHHTQVDCIEWSGKLS